MTLLVVKQEQGKATLLADRGVWHRDIRVASTTKLLKGSMWGRDFHIAITGTLTMAPSMLSITKQMRKTFSSCFEDDVPLPSDNPDLYLEVLVRAMHTLVLAHVSGANEAGIKLDASATSFILISGQSYIYDLLYLSPIKLSEGVSTLGAGADHALTVLEACPDISDKDLFKSVASRCQVSTEFDTVVDTVWK